MNNNLTDMLSMIQKTYQEFEQALKQRGDMNGYIKYDLDEYKHALSKLEGYLNGSDDSMCEHDARIYLSYARAENKNFEQIAKEIDETYKEDGLS